MKPEPTVALLDADFLVYRVGFTTEEDTQEEAEARLTSLLTDIVYFKLKAEDYKAHITGKSNFRFDIAVTHPYKGNRKDFVKPKHYDALRARLIRLGAVVSEGEEADDAVAREASKADYWIVHQDKDIDQVPGWHYNPVKDIKYYVDEFTGLKHFYKQLLTGDRVDNIVCLKGIGTVRADKILKDCKTEGDLYAAVREAYDKGGETPERLLENARLLWLRRTEGELWEPPNEAKQC